MNTRYWVCLMAITLGGCGGGTSTPAPQGDTAPLVFDSDKPSLDGERRWIKAPDKYGYNLGLYEKDGVVYTASHKTRDGINFEPYDTPELNIGVGFRLLSYIDENDRYYLFQATEAPRTREADRWTFYHWTTFGNIRYLAGTSDYLISASYQDAAPELGLGLRDEVEYSIGYPPRWRSIELADGSNMYTNGIAKPADNKSGTILLTDYQQGAWHSDDGGRDWQRILKDMGYLDLTIGSDDYPLDFYAIGRTTARYSPDHGATWSEIKVPDYPVDRWIAGTIDSSNGDVVLWGLSSKGDVVFKSSDKGLNWAPVGPNTNATACVYCTVPDVIANEYGYFISADALFFLPR